MSAGWAFSRRRGVVFRRLNAWRIAAGPGPGVWEVEGALASGAGDASGDVEEPAAEPFWFGVFEFAGERELSEPGEQVLGEQGELEPGLVGRECLEGEPAEAEFL